LRRSTAFGPLSERNFRLLWIGQTTSAFGDRLAPVALAFAVLDLTGSVKDLGYVLSAQVVPMVFFVLLGGVSSDRLPRQFVMLASDLARTATQAGTALLLLTGTARVWQLVALAALYGVADAFFTPASVGLTPLTVSAGRIQQANALRALSISAAGIIGPAFGGVVIATIGPGWALATDAATFLISAASLSLLRLPRKAQRPTAHRSVTRDLCDGWREVRSRRWLWVSILYWAVFNLAGYPAYRVLGPYIAQKHLGGPAAWAAILIATGSGALTGGLIALRTTPHHPLRTSIALTMLWWPPILLLALTAPLPLIAATAFIAAISMGYGNTLWPTILQNTIPDHALSRVSSFDYLSSYALSPIGYAAAGLLATTIGTQTTLASSAALGAIATLATLSVGKLTQTQTHRPASLGTPEPSQGN
jgi:MFS family permease